MGLGMKGSVNVIHFSQIFKLLGDEWLRATPDVVVNYVNFE
jgi:hypothetical protein